MDIEYDQRVKFYLFFKIICLIDYIKKYDMSMILIG
jgi:hypothetical protein